MWRHGSLEWAVTTMPAFGETAPRDRLRPGALFARGAGSDTDVGVGFRRSGGASPGGLRRDADRGGEEPEGVDQLGGEEHGPKRAAVPRETGNGYSESARGGAEQLTELVGGRTHRHHGDLVLGRRIHAQHACHHPAPSVHEGHDGDDRQRQRDGGSHGAEHDDRTRPGAPSVRSAAPVSRARHCALP
jgi:hypothetical protein